MDYSNDHIVYDNGGNPELHADDTTTIAELVRNAGKTFGDKTFLKWEKDGTVYEKSYAQISADTEAAVTAPVDAGSLMGLRMTMTILPIIGMLIACWVFRKKFLLTEEKLNEILDKLGHKK